MFDSIVRMIRRPGPAGPRARLELAAASLLAEMMRLEGPAMADDQAQAIVSLVRARFMLSSPAAQALAELARGDPVETYRERMIAAVIADALQLDDRRRLFELFDRLFASEPTLARASTALRERLSAAIDASQGAAGDVARQA